MTKKPFVTLEKVKEIAAVYPTPFHLYDEKGIRENAKRVNEAFAWNKGFREYFAVKATPNPYILNILKEYGMGCDCSSLPELMLAKELGMPIMFSSNVTPYEEYQFCAEAGGIINLDDFTDVEHIEKALGTLPETMCCRYNPGGVYKLTNGIMDNPGDAKYGMSEAQMTEAFRILKEKGVKKFGIHAFLASNTVTNDYYPQLVHRSKVKADALRKMEKRAYGRLYNDKRRHPEAAAEIEGLLRTLQIESPGRRDSVLSGALSEAEYQAWLNTIRREKGRSYDE